MCLKLSPVVSKAGGKDQQALNMANWSGVFSVNNCLHLTACLKNWWYNTAEADLTSVVLVWQWINGQIIFLLSTIR